MRRVFEDIFIRKYPTLDLHGFDRLSAKVATNDFILENLKLKKQHFVIIHGIGTGIIKEAVHSALNTNKIVAKYKLHGYNLGMTIVTIKLEGE